MYIWWLKLKLFQKNSFSIPSDTSGVFLVKVIQTRRCSSRKHAKIGKFLRIVIKNTIPELIKRRKKRMRAITIRSKHYFRRSDNTSYNFVDNALVILKKRMNTMGKEMLGPTSKELFIRKFRVAFKYIY